MTRTEFASRVGLDPAILAAIIAAVVALFAGCNKTAEDVPSLARWARRPLFGMYHRAKFRAAVSEHVVAAEVDATTALVLARAATLTPAAARAVWDGK